LHVVVTDCASAQEAKRLLKSTAVTAAIWHRRDPAIRKGDALRGRMVANIVGEPAALDGVERRKKCMAIRFSNGA
jgi:hypothetical protein